MTTQISRIGLGFTRARNERKGGYISLDFTNAAILNHGYLAGKPASIVTVAGAVAKRHVHIFESDKFPQAAGQTWSNDDGRYMFRNLDPDKEYTIISRDHEKKYRPVGHDYALPKTDLTADEQRELIETWQT